jgi:hypothetical protein
VQKLGNTVLAVWRHDVFGSRWSIRSMNSTSIMRALDVINRDVSLAELGLCPSW